MNETCVFTYHTRLGSISTLDEVLDAYARLFGQVERSLFARKQADGKAFDLNGTKRSFMARFALTSRQFNAIRIGLDGKIKAVEALRDERETHLLALVTTTQATIKRLGKSKTTPKTLLKRHHQQRRLARHQQALNALIDDENNGRVRIAFGSRKLFRQQFHQRKTLKQQDSEPKLQKNATASTTGSTLNEELDQAQATWKKEWQRARSSQFFVLGSQDEIAGNQSCQASIENDGALSLKLRLPEALVERFGTHVSVSGIRFAYGHDVIGNALRSSRRITYATTDEHCNLKKRTKLIGKALSYRFLRDEKGWRVFVSVERDASETVSHRARGAIGVDVNADHLAVVETDASGNLIKLQRLPLVTYGKSSDQVKAMIGEAATAIATWAQRVGKPVAHEKLDFAKKKRDLSQTVELARGKLSTTGGMVRKRNPEKRYARMLSSLSYRSILRGIERSCFQRGVETIEVNPAYTSLIGTVNHALPRGISVHLGAALAIARRGLGFSERPTPRSGAVQVPGRRNDRITFVLPVRNRAKHAWSFWAEVRRTLLVAHAAQHRSDKSRAFITAMSRVRPVFPGLPKHGSTVAPG